LRSRRGNTGIDQHFSIASSQHGDISARTNEHADVASQILNLDFRSRGFSPNDCDRALLLGKEETWMQTERAGCQTSRG
jgi:hypothetical protein